MEVSEVWRGVCFLKEIINIINLLINYYRISSMIVLNIVFCDFSILLVLVFYS